MGLDMIFRHSKGLQLLFMTEMWERFSFYTLRALLVLYMAGKVSEGGLGWSKSDAITVYGIYMGVAYLTPLIGGYLADRFIGQRTSTMIGAVMMAIGHFFMAFNDIFFFYAALSLVALGNGFFKPCLTSILGELYDDAEESQRDGAFSIFYMGINIGGAISGFAAGWALKAYGYDLGFSIAGIGMLISLLIFWWGKDKYLGTVGLKPQVKMEDDHVKPLTAEERSRLWVVFFIFLLIVFTYIAWEQLGGLVPLFIRDSVDRTLWGLELSVPFFSSLNPIMIIFLAPVLSLLWLWLGKRGKDPFLGAKMGIGFLAMTIGFLLLGWMTSVVSQTDGMLVGSEWIILFNFFIVIGELCITPISWAAATKLAPPSYTTRAMALMLAGSGIGAYLAGVLGSYVDSLGEIVIFYVLTGGLLLMAVFCFLINGKLKQLSHEV